MTITREPADVFGFTVFCDDIRNETGGKQSYIGVYSGRLLIHGDFPFTLPKFGFAITYVQRKDVFQPKVQLHIYLPGDADDTPTMVSEVGEDAGLAGAAAARAEAEILKQTDQTRFISMRANFTIAPLVIAQAGNIKVRAVRGDELIRMGSLQIMKAPEQPLDTPPNNTKTAS